MKKENLLETMEYLAPELIEEAERYQPAKKKWIRLGSIAACICLIGVSILSSQKDNTPQELKISIDESYAAIQEAESCQKEGAEQETQKYRRMISSYDGVVLAIDMAVVDGCCVLSPSLQSAIDAYGDEVNYRVMVEVFRDGTVIDNSCAEIAQEMERLVQEGYVVAYESYEDGTGHYTYFTLHATEGQLLDFPVNEVYGYYLSLYDEGTLCLDQSVESGTIASGSVASEATKYPQFR